MDILDLIKERRSCKSYTDRMVSDTDINKVITAGLYAPSGMNLQDGMIIAITNKEVRDNLAKLNASVMGRDSDPFYGAPVVLLVLVKKHRNSKYDGSCMIENMLLEAYSLGLGSCWIHRAKEELEDPLAKEILKNLDINLDEYEGVGHVILGYSNNYLPKPKPIKENRVLFLK